MFKNSATDFIKNADEYLHFFYFGPGYRIYMKLFLHRTLVQKNTIELLTAMHYFFGHVFVKLCTNACVLAAIHFLCNK